MFEPVVTQWKLRRLIRHWLEFRDGVLRPETLGAGATEQEKSLLRLQARIASLLPLLAQPAPRGAADEAQSHLRAMTELLNKERAPDPEADARTRAEFERRWHEEFVFLNQFRGAASGAPLRRARTPLAPTGIPERRGPRSFPGGAFFGFVCRVGIITFAVYLLGRAFGFRWTANGAELTGGVPKLGAISSDLGQGAQSAQAAILSFVEPVVSTYGENVTLILFGLLLISLAYWFFVRKG